jgi:hypothetical protein
MARSSSDTEPDLQEVMEEVRGILEEFSHTPTTAAPPRRGRESKKGKGAKFPRRNSFQMIREKFRLFLARFARASREPVTLSEVLLPEREENAEIIQARFGRLF